jgi:hypothetical protein
MRHKVSADLTVDTNAAGFRAVMKSAGVQSRLAYEAMRARLRAEDVSGLSFGSGVDVGGRAVSARGWVGASSVDSRTGRVNTGLQKKQAAALAQALHGV